MFLVPLNTTASFTDETQSSTLYDRSRGKREDVGGRVCRKKNEQTERGGRKGQGGRGRTEKAVGKKGEREAAREQRALDIYRRLETDVKK